MNSFTKALLGCNDKAPPVWFMRQAGRYLPSYQALRSKHSLLEMFKTPQLAHQITLLPFEVLELDAAIIFSDILLLFEALGFKVDYPLGKGPQVEAPLSVQEILKSVQRLPIKESLGYVFESIERTKPDLKVPLLGFAATPFTLLAYLLEKPMHESIKTVKAALYQDSQHVHVLLEVLTELVIDYAREAIEAGVDAFQCFDTASTWLSDAAFNQFSLPYTTRVLEFLSSCQIPSLLFSKSSASRQSYYAKLPLNTLSVDWTASLRTLQSALPHMGLQGNLDPYLTTLEFPLIQEELATVLAQMEANPRFIFNLGHGVLPETRLETLQAIIAFIKNSHQVAVGGIEQRIASGLP